jgi:hypothetical protein
MSEASPRIDGSSSEPSMGKAISTKVAMYIVWFICFIAAMMGIWYALGKVFPNLASMFTSVLGVTKDTVKAANDFNPWLAGAGLASGKKKARSSYPAKCPDGYKQQGLDCAKGGLSEHNPSKLMPCPDGYTNTGSSCFRGAKTYLSGKSKLIDCPSGYTNTGVSCYKKASSYGKGCTTIFKKYHCRSGYTDNGCLCGRGASSLSLAKQTCPTGYFRGAFNRCYPECKPGYSNLGATCTKGASSLSLAKQTCPTGYFKGALNRCYKTCGTDQTNTGEYCYNNIMRKGMSSMTCKPGEHFNSGRCYKPCDAGYKASNLIWCNKE